MIKPRDYQIEALNALKEGRLRGEKRQLVALPTGSGKTIVAAYDLKRVVKSTGLGAIFMAHRDELITQPAEKIPLVWEDVEIGRVKAEDNQLGRQVTIASVQTIQREKRLQQLIDAQPYSLLYVDEAHHSTADSYKRIINGLTEANPDLVIVGLTATPVRSDGTRMSEIFEEITYQRTMLDLIEAGYLSDLELQQVALDVSIDGIPRIAGDLKPSEVRRIVTMPEIMASMVAAWKENASPRRTIAFGVDVEHARQLANAFQQNGVSADVIWGEMPIEDRRARLHEFQSGKLQVLVNVMILCLDAKTEILTDKGWTGKDEMTFDHKVANYDPESGGVTFEHPLDIVKRPRSANERMVSLETPRRSIRVTEGHRMLYRTTPNGMWRKKPARDLVGKKAQLPVSTTTQPKEISVEQEPKLTQEQLHQLVTAQMHNLMRKPGLSRNNAITEAKRRVARRRSMLRTEPTDLTVDDCMLIGFWIGDGSKCRVKNRITNYKLTQGRRWQNIIDWIDNLIQRTKLNATRTDRESHTIWLMPRGTGGGEQERNGVYRLEPYLDKTIPEIFWALNEKQFDAFIYGLWMADGNHGIDGKGRKGRKEGKSKRRRRMQMEIYQSKEKMLSRLQAIATCRGWRATLRGPDKGIYRLSLSKQQDHRMTKHRLRLEDKWVEEQVWCVRTRTSNLITRRNGSVTFMGNTEGFDDTALEDAPPLSCIMLARPTLSQSLYIQQIGRGLRPSPDKESCLILDFAYNSNRHHIVQLPHLFGMEELPKLGSKKKPGEAHPKHIPSILAAVQESRKVDFRQPPPRAGFRWAKSEFGFALSMSGSYGFMVIRPEDGSSTEFNVFHIEPPQDDFDTMHENKKRVYKSEEYKEHKLTSKPLSFEWAFGLAEDSCRELYETRSRGRKMLKRTILDRDADWLALAPTENQMRVLSRQNKQPKSRGEATNMITCMIVERILRDRTPATQKQIGYLRWQKIPFRSGITKGEATRLISDSKAKTAAK